MLSARKPDLKSLSQANILFSIKVLDNDYFNIILLFLSEQYSMLEALVHRHLRTSEQIVLPSSTEAVILEAVRSRQYGSAEITAHDSRVVQIECKKGIWLDPRDSKES